MTFVKGKDISKEDVLPSFWLLNDEPDTLINRCMVLQYESEGSLWNWDSCDRPLPFICEFGL